MQTRFTYQQHRDTLETMKPSRLPELPDSAYTIQTDVDLEKTLRSLALPYALEEYVRSQQARIERA
jgi:hypothetical protein